MSKRRPTKRALQLHRETIAALDDAELARVGGGRGTVTPPPPQAPNSKTGGRLCNIGGSG